jgi:CheY-like chemotaxis protein
VVVRPAEFEVKNLFGALRGMLRPLLVTTSVSLVFDEPDLPPLVTDEGKVSQILRNLISNALKFTEHGEVRVSAHAVPDGCHVAFSVRDTGIGIASEDHELIFREFTQLDSPLQRRAKGTGLGLPLSRKLAGLLGGRILLESEPGAGSTFTLELPAPYRASEELEPEMPPAAEGDDLPAILVVEDNPEMLLVYERYLSDTPYEVVRATSLARARRLLGRGGVRAIVLDILLTGEDSWSFLAELKSTPATSAIPVVVVTQVDDPQKALTLGADAFSRKPPSRQWLVATLHRLIGRAVKRRALVVDDEEASRYLWSRILMDVGWLSVEAAGGERGLELARTEQPDVILLDFTMPAPDGLAVLDAIRADERTSRIPVIVMSSKVLDEHEARAISDRGAQFLTKSLSVADARRALSALLRGIAGGSTGGDPRRGEEAGT